MNNYTPLGKLLFPKRRRRLPNPKVEALRTLSLQAEYLFYIVNGRIPKASEDRYREIRKYAELVSPRYREYRNLASLSAEELGILNKIASKRIKEIYGRCSN